MGRGDPWEFLQDSFLAAQMGKPWTREVRWFLQGHTASGIGRAGSDQSAESTVP